MRWVRAFEKGIVLPQEWRIKGYEVIDGNDEYVAPVYDLLCEEETGVVRYLMAEIGGLMGIAGKKVLLPEGILRRAASGQIIASGALVYIQDAPSPDDPEQPTRTEEEMIFRHFGLTPYWDSLVDKRPEEGGAEEHEEN